MDNIENILKEFYDNKVQIQNLIEKNQKLREIMLNFLDEKQINSSVINPFKIWHLEYPIYQYNVGNIFEKLQSKNKFLDVVKIDSTRFSKLLEDHELSDRDVEDLLLERLAVGIRRYFYIRQEK